MRTRNCQSKFLKHKLGIFLALICCMYSCEKLSDEQYYQQKFVEEESEIKKLDSMVNLTKLPDIPLQ